MAEESATPDAVIARIAARQHGVVLARQLVAAGVSKDRIYGRCRTGRLHRLHRGVYAVGHRNLSNEGRWIAATLACGGGAVLSHCSAAALWQLLPTDRGPIDVSVPGSGGRRKRAGITLHRCRSFTQLVCIRRDRIPVTTPARTIADLRRVVDPATVGKAIRQAELLGLPFGASPEADHTRSELETIFLEFCRRHRLPAPEVNVRVGPYLVDFLWRDQRLVAETDGYRFHRGRIAFENDRSRDLQLRGLGFEVIRLSYRQIVDEPARVAYVLRLSLEV